MMGIAAYNRGSRVISDQIARDRKHPDAEVVDSLNAEPKHQDAAVPWGPVHLSPGHGGWWVECPRTGFGFWYPTVRAAMREWRICIVSIGMRYGEVVYVAEPFAVRPPVCARARAGVPVTGPNGDVRDENGRTLRLGGHEVWLERGAR